MDSAIPLHHEEDQTPAAGIAKIEAANLAGIAAPWLAGVIVQINGSSRLAFFITGSVAIAGAFFWAFLVRRVEPVQWSVPAPASAN